jgi:hypothetical protein
MKTEAPHSRSDAHDDEDGINIFTHDLYIQSIVIYAYTTDAICQDLLQLNLK